MWDRFFNLTTIPSKRYHSADDLAALIAMSGQYHKAVKQYPGANAHVPEPSTLRPPLLHRDICRNCVSVDEGHVACGGGCAGAVFKVHSYTIDKPGTLDRHVNARALTRRGGLDRGHHGVTAVAKNLHRRIVDIDAQQR